MQYMKLYSRASYYCVAHELLLACSTQKLTQVQPILCHTHVLTRVTAKIEEHMCVHHTRMST